jgi:hypothetical protein
LPIEKKRVLVETFIGYILWRVLDLLFGYMQSLISSIPVSFQIFPSVSWSNILSLPFAVLLIIAIFTLWERQRKSRPLDKLPPDGKITIPHRQKRVSWFSKLKRLPIRKEKRADFWMSVIMLAFAGVAIIVMTLGFTPESIPPEAISTFLVTKYITIVFGIVMIVLSFFLSISEGYALWEARKRRIADLRGTYLNIIEDFDKSFQALTQITEPKTKEMLLKNFQNKLKKLCQEYPWSEEKRLEFQNS